MTGRTPSTRISSTRTPQRRATARGNRRKSPTPAPGRTPRSRWIPWSFLAVATLAGLSWGAVAGYHTLLARGFFDIAQIEISGNAHLSEAQILARLNLPQGVTLPDVDLAAVATSVLSHPWTRRVVVRRLYPGTLRIRVWERTPAAIASATAAPHKGAPPAMLIDTEGVLLGPVPKPPPALPRLTGFALSGHTTGDRVSRSRLRTGLLVARAYGDRPALVDVTDPHDPLLLVAGLRVRLGDRGGYTWRLERLHRLAAALRELDGPHGVEVDLSLADRVVARPL